MRIEYGDDSHKALIFFDGPIGKENRLFSELFFFDVNYQFDFFIEVRAAIAH